MTKDIAPEEEEKLRKWPRENPADLAIQLAAPFVLTSTGPPPEADWKFR